MDRANDPYQMGYQSADGSLITEAQQLARVLGGSDLWTAAPSAIGSAENRYQDNAFLRSELINDVRDEFGRPISDPDSEVFPSDAMFRKSVDRNQEKILVRTSLRKNYSAEITNAVDKMLSIDLTKVEISKEVRALAG